MTILISILFILGYTAIAFEHAIKINKTASAIITGVLCWTVYAVSAPDPNLVIESLGDHLGEVSGILFFLLGAMTIVELIDAHDGFEIITDRINTKNKKQLVWLVAFITFLLSSILDNLTTTIVLVSLLRKIIPEKNDRLLFAGLVIIAANAGGAWSPIGDVTTTMLWIGGQITTTGIIIQTGLASLVCLVVPTFVIASQVKGNITNAPSSVSPKNYETQKKDKNLIFWIGVSSLLFVPIFKTITHLPPYMGILFGLGALWVVSELIHSDKDEEEKGLLSVNHALHKIDTSSVLFFLGILLSIGALQSIGLLSELAIWMDKAIGNISVITVLIGLLSAVIDNVPLVAAAQGMYSMETYPTDHYFWAFLAYCAGTGGSCLIIGSAAGVAAMGMEKIDFLWYLKKIGWLALLGYLSGAIVFLLQQYLFQ